MYRLVRYEDLVLNPVKVTRELYGFIGVTYSDSVERFITENTNSSANSSSQLFSTSRRSDETADKWKHVLNSSVIHSVDSVCSKILHTLGYS